jgi:hypothetical protein
MSNILELQSLSVSSSADCVCVSLISSTVGGDQ